MPDQHARAQLGQNGDSLSWPAMTAAASEHRAGTPGAMAAETLRCVPVRGHMLLHPVLRHFGRQRISTPASAAVRLRQTGCEPLDKLFHAYCGTDDNSDEY